MTSMDYTEATEAAEIVGIIRDMLWPPNLTKEEQADFPWSVDHLHEIGALLLESDHWKQTVHAQDRMTTVQKIGREMAEGAKNCVYGGYQVAHLFGMCSATLAEMFEEFAKEFARHSSDENRTTMNALMAGLQWIHGTNGGE